MISTAVAACFGTIILALRLGGFLEIRPCVGVQEGDAMKRTFAAALFVLLASASPATNWLLQDVELLSVASSSRHVVGG
jgi:hypothetical protein